MLWQRFKGQYHLLQRQFGEDLVPGNPQLAAEINQALEVAESRMMMFEFAEFGSLGALLKKVSDPVKGPGDPCECFLAETDRFGSTHIMDGCEDHGHSCFDCFGPHYADFGLADGLHADRGQPLPDRALMHVLQCC